MESEAKDPTSTCVVASTSQYEDRLISPEIGEGLGDQLGMAPIVSLSQDYIHGTMGMYDVGSEGSLFQGT